MTSTPELLAPAGSLEKLKTAIHYGADAVYLGGKAFGLRAKAVNFDTDELAEAVAFAHERDVRVFVTVNIMAHNRDLEALPAYLRELEALRPIEPLHVGRRRPDIEDLDDLASHFPDFGVAGFIYTVRCDHLWRYPALAHRL